jgi:hypothetical protein
VGWFFAVELGGGFLGSSNQFFEFVFGNSEDFVFVLYIGFLDGGLTPAGALLNFLTGGFKRLPLRHK